MSWRRLLPGVPVLMVVLGVVGGCTGGTGSGSAATTWKPPRTVVPPWATPAVLPAPSTASAWRVLSPAFTPSTIDCVTATVCQATASGGLAVSHDGGRRWTWEAAPGGVAPTQVTCATADRCWAVVDAGLNGGGYVDVTTDGGARWTPTPLPGFRRHIPLTVAAMACPSPQECVAVGTAGSTVPKAAVQAAYLVRTGDGGRSWRAVALATGTPLLQSVSCPTARRCVAVGGHRILVSGSGGRQWRQERAPEPVGRLASVSCWTATRCLAVGTVAPHPSIGGANRPVGAVTGDGGRRWQAVTLPSAVAALTQVACTAAGTCVVTGPYVTGPPILARTTDGGHHWTTMAAPGPATGAAGYLDCPIAGRCLDATGAGLFAADPLGGSWVGVTTPGPVPTSEYDTPAAVSCPAPGDWTVASRFMALAGGGSAAPFPLALTTTDNGHRWRSSTVANSDVQTRPGVSCPTTSTCQIVDAAGLYRSTDGGGSWSRQPLPAAASSPGADPMSVSCPDTQVCVAVGLGSQGVAVIATDDAGATWTTANAPAADGALSGVSCAADGTCVAVGATTEVLSDDRGQTWRPAHVPAGTGPLAAVSCPTSDMCVAVGGSPTAGHRAAVIITSSDGGATWTAVDPPAGTGALRAVSCPSTQLCVAVGYATAVETVDGGRRWQAMSLPAGLPTLTAVSCAAADDCTAVGLDGQGHGLIATTASPLP